MAYVIFHRDTSSASRIAAMTILLTPFLVGLAVISAYLYDGGRAGAPNPFLFKVCAGTAVVLAVLIETLWYQLPEDVDE